MPAISQSNLLQSLGWALINSLWQMAILWIAYHLINSFIKLKSDKKVSLATTFVIGGFAWFVYTFVASYINGNLDNPARNIAGAMMSEENWSNFSRQLLPLASAAYLLVLVIPVWQFIKNFRYVQTIRTKGLEKIDAQWRMFVGKYAPLMGIKKKVRVWLSHLVESPVTIGYLKPVILIPVAAINQLSTQQVEAVLLHELSHIRRYDYLFNLIVNMIRTVLYFNPFVKAFVSSIEKERELSCDELVMQFQYRPHEYASALLMLERSSNSRFQMMMAAAKSNNLLTRVESILGIHKRDRFSIRRVVGAFAILVCIICMNAFLFMGRQKHANNFSGFAMADNPYYFMSDEGSAIEKINVPVLMKEKQLLVKKEKEIKVIGAAVTPKPEAEVEAFIEDKVTPAYYYQFVNNLEPVIPELQAAEVAKVKGTLEATKKILEEKEWKEVEKGYAELLNSKEKALLKSEFVGEVNSFDWNKLETQLSLAYDKVDWAKIDNQVNHSLAIIRLDSLNNVMKQSLSDLNKMECWMKTNKTDYIPDTEITLKVVQNAQMKVKTQISEVRAIKQKKIIKL